MWVFSMSDLAMMRSLMQATVETGESMKPSASPYINRKKTSEFAVESARTFLSQPFGFRASSFRAACSCLKNHRINSLSGVIVC